MASRSGMYDEGILDEGCLNKVLELHNRAIMSTLGTHSTRRVSKSDVSTSQVSNITGL